MAPSHPAFVRSLLHVLRQTNQGRLKSALRFSKISPLLFIQNQGLVKQLNEVHGKRGSQEWLYFVKAVCQSQLGFQLSCQVNMTNCGVNGFEGFNKPGQLKSAEEELRKKYQSRSSFILMRRSIWTIGHPPNMHRLSHRRCLSHVVHAFPCSVLLILDIGCAASLIIGVQNQHLVGDDVMMPMWERWQCPSWHRSELILQKCEFWHLLYGKCEQMKGRLGSSLTSQRHTGDTMVQWILHKMRLQTTQPGCLFLLRSSLLVCSEE